MIKLLHWNILIGNALVGMGRNYPVVRKGCQSSGSPGYRMLQKIVTTVTR